MAKEKTEYRVSIAETSGELTKKQEITMKDLENHIQLVDLEEAVRIHPTGYVVLDVHNTKSDMVDYRKYVIIAEEGTYVTGSDVFFQKFLDIYEDMKGETEEWGIEIIQRPSKNYKDKNFLSCVIF